ncbi:hypothetical protein AB0I10_15195 [Streptomyces sp. NPDC050636]|uniref:hypothetical protein n=1 Tax=Streptomyces sp. NPDC050636 TaxID=3154510 RepID=UPI00344021FE
MRRTTTVASASAAVLCLSVLLAGCGSAPEKGYIAVGAAGPTDGRAPTKAVPPEGGVELTPLDGGSEGRGDGVGRGDGEDRGGSATESRPGTTGGPSPGTSAPPAPPPEARPEAPGGSSPSPNSPSPPGDSASPGGSSAPKPPSPTTPAGPDTPDGLVIGKPRLAGTDVRWCQKVTLDFLHTGKQPVTSGTVTFGSHIIGPLGIDWATVDSTHELPLPLAPGEKRTGTWRVCVDAWRVPLGMHIETQDAAFNWK